MRRFTEAIRYVRDDVINCDLKIKSVFAEIKKLAMKFHGSTTAVRNPPLISIRHHDRRFERGLKRPIAIHSREGNFMPSFKTLRRNPSEVT